MKPYSKRRQSLPDLHDEPPKDLATFRQLVMEETVALDRAIADVEGEFYGDLTALGFIRREAPRIRRAMEIHKMAELSSLRQLETIIRFARDPEVSEATAGTSVRPGRIDREEAAMLMALQNRLLEFVPGRFNQLLRRTQSLLVQCERYLSAFYTLDVDPPIETAKIYARNIKVWHDLVRQCVNHLFELPQLFLRGGLSLARFSSAAIDLLERAEMLACPILGIFPDCCDHLREASSLLAAWVKHDEQYSVYLSNDLAELEAQRAQRSNELKRSRHRSAMLQYRLKQLQSDQARLQVELESLLEKEADLTVDDEALFHEQNRLQVDLEIKEFRRDELRRQQDSFEPEEFQEAFGQVMEELRILRARAPIVRRRRAGVRLKLDWIESKRAELRSIATQIRTLDAESRQLRRSLIEEELRLDGVLAGMDKCKEIQRLKSSPDVLKKIFYNMPLPPSKGPTRTEDSPRPHLPRLSPEGRSPKPSTVAATSDDASRMARVMAVVGRRIGRDWPRLYRALPFIPRRGQETIDNDVRDIEAEFVGDALKERGGRALKRWSRFHTRACVEDIRKAVDSLGRQDLVNHINHIQFPVVQSSVKEEEPIPDFISKDLIPYYRDVQKFDRLRAAHRI